MAQLTEQELKQKLEENTKKISQQNFNDFLDVAEIEGFNVYEKNRRKSFETARELYDLRLKDKIADELNDISVTLRGIFERLDQWPQ